MTITEAIEQLEYMKSLIESSGKDWVDERDLPLIDLVMDLLKKQIPKQWQKENRGGVEYTAVCPECGYGTYWSDAGYYEYCPLCGQKLDMEIEE